MTRLQYAAGLVWACILGATLGYLFVMALALVYDATARETCGRTFEESQ